MSIFDRAARYLDDVLLPDELRATLDAAEKALDDDLAREAEELFVEVLKERPELLRAQLGVARARHAQGKLEAARAALLSARRNDPDEPEVALLSARLAQEAGDHPRAIAEARDAARHLLKEGGRRFAEASALRARSERALGRPDRAARELRKALAAFPRATFLRAELAEALLLAGKNLSAVAVIRQIDLAELEKERIARLGLALFGAGEREAARPLLSRIAPDGAPEVIGALARDALAEGEVAEAERLARTSVARGGGASALSTLAEVLLATGREGEAAEALLAASFQSGGDPERMRRAARILPLAGRDNLVRYADALDAHAPGDPLGVALRAHAELEIGRLDAAAALLASLEGKPGEGEPKALLAGVRLSLERGRAREALDRLGALDQRGADPRGAGDSGRGLPAADRAAADALRRRALRLLFAGPEGSVDLAAAIDAVARFAKSRGLDAVQRSALALRDELDRPLLLAILGEFNAGKSTLVNAFVGADVAPTGIVPTTATLNILRGGAERRVRVVRKDGTTREGAYEDLRRLLEEADQAEGEHTDVDHVEIVLPSEILERVWILDTPGSNAPEPEHEALAREAMRRADAALWIFNAGQAGKASEGLMLKAVAESRRWVLPALNKVDRLKEGQLDQVRKSLAKELPGIGERAVPLSAKKALKARLAGDEEAFEASGFPALMRTLEEEVFLRARPLKRRACAGRLLAVLDEALATEEGAFEAYERRLASLRRKSAPLSEVGVELDRAAEAALDQLRRKQNEAFEEAAREVLSFVRPRTNRFATHGADLEDRAFLSEVIDQRLAAASMATGSLLRARLRASLSFVAEAPAAAPGGAAEAGALSLEDLDRRIKSRVDPVLADFVGYQRGLLHGGALRRFFDEFLPRAELELGAIAEALRGARAHPEQRLKGAMSEALDDLSAELSAELAARIARSESERDAARVETYEPLRVLREVLEDLVD